HFQIADALGIAQHTCRERPFCDEVAGKVHLMHDGSARGVILCDEIGILVLDQAMAVGIWQVHCSQDVPCVIGVIDLTVPISTYEDSIRCNMDPPKTKGGHIRIRNAIHQYYLGLAGKWCEDQERKKP